MVPFHHPWPPGGLGMLFFLCGMVLTQLKRGYLSCVGVASIIIPVLKREVRGTLCIMSAPYFFLSILEYDARITYVCKCTDTIMSCAFNLVS